MGKIFYIMGKSSSGKDTIYKKLLEDKTLQLKTMVMYTTRPIRKGETNGEEYFFVSEEQFLTMEKAHQIIEARAYHTMHGVWRYFTVNDQQINLEENNYIIIGTLESYISTRDYFGKDKVLPIYIDLDDGERLQRALSRERGQSQPKYTELCRRYLADEEDFSLEKREKAGIEKSFYNEDLEECKNNVLAFINENK